MAIFALLKIFVAFAGSILGWLAINASSWSSSSVVLLDRNSFQQILTSRRACLSATTVSVIVKGSVIFFASNCSFFSICLLQSMSLRRLDRCILRMLNFVITSLISLLHGSIRLLRHLLSACSILAVMSSSSF